MGHRAEPNSAVLAALWPQGLQPLTFVTSSSGPPVPFPFFLFSSIHPLLTPPSFLVASAGPQVLCQNGPGKVAVAGERWVCEGVREEGEAESKKVEHFVQVKGQRVWLRNSGSGLGASQLCLPAGCVAWGNPPSSGLQLPRLQGGGPGGGSLRGAVGGEKHDLL